jgi:hypothetical protein
MQLSNLLPIPSRHRWLTVLAGVAWAGASVGPAEEAAGAGDGVGPVVVAAGESKAVQAPEPPPPAATTVASPAPSQGLTGEAAVVRKAIVDGTSLLDPTAPTPVEATANEAPGTNAPASPLLPQPPSGTGTAPALAPPETSAAVKPVEPIMGSAPFAPEGKPDGGPVVMGADLQPNAAVTPLTPDQADPEFLDAPLVEATDRWVFGVEAGSFYDDNIRLSRTDEQQDFIFVLSASVAWQWGDVRLKRGSWARLFYKATGILFAEQSDEDNIDHDVQAGVQRRSGRLATVLEGRFRRLSGSTPDLGDRVQREDYQAKLSATYEFSGRTYLEGNVAWNGVRYLEPGLSDYQEFLGELFAGYEVSGRTKVAVGAAAGQLQADGAGRQDFQRALLKVTRASTGALGLTGKAGAEFRQTQAGNQVTPVLAMTADYEPIEDGTRLTGEVFREVVASGALAGENFLRTGGALRLTQRLGSRFVAGLEAGYERLDYSNTGDGTASGRADDYYYAKPSLKYEFNNRRRAEIFYSFREDDSSVEDFSFSANQWGLSIGLDF